MKKFLERVGRSHGWHTSTHPNSKILFWDTSFCTDELKLALNDYGPRDMVDIQGFIWIVAQPGSIRVLSKTKKDEFSGLYREFTRSYLPSKAGKDHIAFYEKGRELARQNLDEITKAVERGSDVTDAVLLKLLPYSNTKGNRERVAWVHVAPAITKDLKDWYQKAGRTHPRGLAQNIAGHLGFYSALHRRPLIN